MIKSALRFSVAVALAASSSAIAQSASNDWGTFRGPNNDGTVAAPKSVADWKAATISQLWKAETSTGFSSFAVAGGKAYTIVTREADGNTGETVVCYDARSARNSGRSRLP